MPPLLVRFAVTAGGGGVVGATVGGMTGTLEEGLWLGFFVGFCAWIVLAAIRP
jgi:hypothetical protein